MQLTLLQAYTWLGLFSNLKKIVAYKYNESHIRQLDFATN